MIIVNIDYIPGKKIEVVGMARGSIIQSKNLGKDIMSGLKTLVGGELTHYSEMMNEARAKATKRMADDAASQGADAVINVRYASSAVMQGAAEVMAYGTAVKLSDA
ncbi:MAG: YbjQ family protein [Clostridiales bacterium]|nr:YbjQ family protein [Clostridiales bacterium]